MKNSPHTTPHKRKKILVADDDTDDIDILTEVFNQLDEHAAIAAVQNGGQVFKYLSGIPDEELPCIIVLDYKMPILNAAEVLEKFGNDDRYAHIPKVVWSTSARQEDMNRCLKAGARQYFIKPSNASELKRIAGLMLKFCA